MNFIPFNRYLLVEPIKKEEEKKQNVTIVLPEDYNKPVSPYVACKVLQVSEDSRFVSSVNQGDSVVVERRMLCTVDIMEKPIYLVLENYIYGRIIDENNT